MKNELILLSENNIKTENSVTLICVLKNELLLLPRFIEYYKNLGIDNFYFC